MYLNDPPPKKNPPETQNNKSYSHGHFKQYVCQIIKFIVDIPRR